MPNVNANGISMYYEQQGSGEPLILIPFLTADNACYAFQIPEYAKQFTCITLDLRGTGQSDKPAANYTTETLADDVAGLMSALGVEKAHVSGFSLGAAVALWLAAKQPDKVKSLSVHGGWDRTDLFQKTVIEHLQMTAKSLDSVPEMVITALFPWCFTPELYVGKPEFIQAVKDFVHSRPAQSVPQFMLQSNAVLSHDVAPVLGRITAPTQLTVGAIDLITSTRYTNRLKPAIRQSELFVFERCAHASLFEQSEEFNRRTLAFLQRQVGVHV